MADVEILACKAATGSYLFINPKDIIGNICLIGLILLYKNAYVDWEKKYLICHWIP